MSQTFDTATYSNEMHKPLVQMHLQDFFFPALSGSVLLNCRCDSLTSENFNLLDIHMNIHTHTYMCVYKLCVYFREIKKHMCNYIHICCQVKDSQITLRRTKGI